MGVKCVWIAYIIVLMCLWIFRWQFKQGKVPVGYEAAKDAIALMREWSSWMAGIQTLSLAALGALIGTHPTQSMKQWATTAVICMGIALLIEAWVLSALPIVRMNLNPGPGVHKDNDIYEHPLYTRVPVTLGVATFLQHTFWVFGIISFGGFLLAMFW